MSTVASPERKLWYARGSCLIQIGCGAQLNVYEAVHMMNHGISGTTIGILLAIGNALIIVMSPLWGRTADRLGIYRRFIAVGTFGISGTLLWFAFSETTADFVVYVMMKGILMPSVMGVMPALALANLPADAQGKGFGSYRSFGSIGFMTGTMVLPHFLPSITSIAVFVALVMPFSLIFVFGLDRPKERTASEEAAFKVKLPGILYWFLAASFLTSLTDPAINGFYNSFGSSLGAPLEWIGFVSGINGVIAFFCLPLMGRWIDLHGARIFLVLGFAAQGLRLLAASWITAPEWLWMPNLFHSFGWAGREVAMVVFVTLIAGPTKRATAISLLLSTKMAGLTVGSFLMGRLSDLYGFPVMFRSVAVLAACSLIFLFFVFQREKALSNANPVENEKS